MTQDKINSRGLIVDYNCAGEVGGVIAPVELIGYSAFMLRSCDFLQYEVDAITYRQGLPFTHADGTLYKLSEYPDSAYYKEQKEDQMNRLLFLDLLLKEYPERKITGYDYEAIEEAKEAKEREEIKKKKEAVKGVPTIDRVAVTLVAKAKGNVSSCDTLVVK